MAKDISREKWYKNLFRWFIKFTGWIPAALVFKTRYIYEDKKVQSRHIKGPAIIAVNHLRWVDPILITQAFVSRYVRCLIAETIYDNYGPMTRHFSRMMGCIKVDRYTANLGFIGKCNEILLNDGVIQIYPEGRIANNINDPMRPFKPSAILMSIQTKAPIIPVYHKGIISVKKREVVVIGKPIYFHELCNNMNPTFNELEKLTKLLENKIMELKELSNNYLTK